MPHYGRKTTKAWYKLEAQHIVKSSMIDALLPINGPQFKSSKIYFDKILNSNTFAAAKTKEWVCANEDVPEDTTNDEEKDADTSPDVSYTGLSTNADVPKHQQEASAAASDADDNDDAQTLVNEAPPTRVCLFCGESFAPGCLEIYNKVASTLHTKAKSSMEHVFKSCSIFDDKDLYFLSKTGFDEVVKFLAINGHFLQMSFIMNLLTELEGTWPKPSPSCKCVTKSESEQEALPARLQVFYSACKNPMQTSKFRLVRQMWDPM
ncbi:hypothetical protein GGX14DRAFT_405431 [Mycena pura]|uniref:Uncharacterized protein n=1 Tax=Mycena pura TaxID=153505 RepID=A0AAD6UVJ8_9AGAR|nr:hypothetical protein GGX14DRAFT_405431 [Mycena pura]